MTEDGATRFTTTLTIRPELVAPERYGHHKSFCVRGRRVWDFADPEGADRFERDANHGGFRHPRHQGEKGGVWRDG